MKMRLFMAVIGLELAKHRKLALSYALFSVLAALAPYFFLMLLPAWGSFHLDETIAAAVMMLILLGGASGIVLPAISAGALREASMENAELVLPVSPAARVLGAFCACLSCFVAIIGGVQIIVAACALSSNASLNVLCQVAQTNTVAGLFGELVALTIAIAALIFALTYWVRRPLVGAILGVSIFMSAGYFGPFLWKIENSLSVVLIPPPTPKPKAPPPPPPPPDPYWLEWSYSRQRNLYHAWVATGYPHSGDFRYLTMHDVCGELGEVGDLSSVPYLLQMILRLEEKSRGGDALDHCIGSLSYLSERDVRVSSTDEYENQYELDEWLNWWHARNTVFPEVKTTAVGTVSLVRGCLSLPSQYVALVTSDVDWFYGDLRSWSGDPTMHFATGMVGSWVGPGSQNHYPEERLDMGGGDFLYYVYLRKEGGGVIFATFRGANFSAEVKAHIEIAQILQIIGTYRRDSCPQLRAVDSGTP